MILIKLLLSQYHLYGIRTKKVNQLQCKIRVSHEPFEGLPADIWVCCMERFLLSWNCHLIQQMPFKLKKPTNYRKYRQQSQVPSYRIY